MCIPFQSIEPPTQGTQKAVKLLQFLAIAELVVILLKLIVVEDFTAFFELIMIFILYSAWAQLNYCSCVFFVLFCLYEILFIFVIFGTRVQDGNQFFGSSGSRLQAILIVEFLFFFYYGGAAYVAFLAYKYSLFLFIITTFREFKIFSYEANSGGAFGGLMGGGYDQEDQQGYPQQQQQQTYNQYTQQQYAQPPPQTQQQRFQAFQGRGQQIG